MSLLERRDVSDALLSLGTFSYISDSGERRGSDVMLQAYVLSLLNNTFINRFQLLYDAFPANGD